jgi:hypothetical protein
MTKEAPRFAVSFLRRVPAVDAVNLFHLEAVPDDAKYEPDYGRP